MKPLNILFLYSLELLHTMFACNSCDLSNFHITFEPLSFRCFTRSMLRQSFFLRLSEVLCFTCIVWCHCMLMINTGSIAVPFIFLSTLNAILVFHTRSAAYCASSMIFSLLKLVNMHSHKLLQNRLLINFYLFCGPVLIDRCMTERTLHLVSLAILHMMV